MFLQVIHGIRFCLQVNTDDLQMIVFFQSQPVKIENLIA